ncbi:MAG TPA: tetratricopeptide repeat protein [Verrucomicrobiae bacterium]|nr:tetratricopeptide repeat protein [Verrucomicrobiae bacterium]
MKKRRPNPKASKAPKTPAGPTRGQRIAFRVIALVLMPLIALGLLEAGLRLAGYGYDTAFFKELRIGDTDFLVNNDDFVRRFFPPNLTRLPEVLRMEKEKPPGVTRIFILGESAALGDPAPAYAAARYMRALLSERFPGHPFEVVNVAITAINSHAILPIARACAKHQGDFWIVYMGNNEMVGPFGAASVFGAQAPPRWMVRVSLALQELRAGQLLMAATRDLKSKGSSAASWGGMEMFLGNQIPPDDARKTVVYRNFGENLRDIVRAGLDCGARVILNTVAVNLRDCPPFASSSTNGAHSASAEYQNAQSLLSRGNIDAARAEFQKACDDDTLPFRADSHINALIRDAATQFAGPNLVFCDAAAPATFGESPTNIPGDELFYEHVHLNFDGNYRLGRAWAEKITPLLPANIRGSDVKEWASQDLCERRLGLSDWNRAIVLSEVIRRREKPPLSGEANNAQELQQLHGELNDVGRRMNKSDADNARAVYLDDIQRDPDDYVLRFGYGDFLEETHAFSDAVAQWRQIQDLLPQYYLVYLQQGRMLERVGQLNDARAAFRRTVEIYPRMTVAWFEMSNIDASQGRYAEAMDECERARKLEPTQPAFYACLGQLLGRMGRHTEAIDKYRESIKVQAGYFDGYLGLAEELEATGKAEEAADDFSQAAQLKPGSARAHLEFGQALLKLNRRDDARRQFEETVRLEPGNAAARQYLSQ